MKVHKSIKRTYSLGPYETLHIESSIELDDPDKTLDELRQEVEEVVIRDFLEYKAHVFDVVENHATERHHNSEIKNAGKESEKKNDAFQNSFLRDD